MKKEQNLMQQGKQKMNEIFIKNNSAHGLVLKISDSTIADVFEDYISEEYYIPFSLKDVDDGKEFYFGQIASVDLLDEIIVSFVSQKLSH
jgi:hypothetical protein